MKPVHSGKNGRPSAAIFTLQIKYLQKKISAIPVIATPERRHRDSLRLRPMLPSR
jgi:hypothetical protein